MKLVLLFVSSFSLFLHGPDKLQKELDCLQKPPAQVVVEIKEKNFIRAWRQFSNIQRTFWYERDDLPELKRASEEILLMSTENGFDNFGQTLGVGVQRYVSLCCDLYRRLRDDVDQGQVCDLLLSQANLFHKSLLSSTVVAGKIRLIQKKMS